MASSSSSICELSTNLFQRLTNALVPGWASDSSWVNSSRTTRVRGRKNRAKKGWWMGSLLKREYVEKRKDERENREVEGGGCDGGGGSDGGGGDASAGNSERTGELLLWFGLLNCKQIPTFCSIDYRLAPSAETSLPSYWLHETPLRRHSDDVEFSYSRQHSHQI